MIIKVQAKDFDIAAEIRAVNSRNSNIGALVSFIGQVRDFSEQSNILKLTLEHYPGMTERSLWRIAEDARKRWKVTDITIVHRVGELGPSDQIVLVLVASQHRGEAFAACEFIMDYLKTTAPFWKKELSGSGSKWVDAKHSDDVALSKWA